MFKKLSSIFLAFSISNASIYAITPKKTTEMTLDEKIGQMVCLDFRNWQNSKNSNSRVTKATCEICDIIGKYHLGSVILFSENFVSKEQLKKLISDLQKASIDAKNPPLIVAVDQEGGLVERFRFDRKERFKNNADIRSAEEAYKKGEAIAKELKEVGINCNLAPVADVNSNPYNPVIGVRSFSDKADVVAEYCRNFLNGLHSQNIMGTAKHFPGHGDTNVDSHFSLPVVNKTLKELEELELVPFKALIDEGVDLIMTAHIQLPKVETGTVISKKDDSKINIPATLSRTVLTDLLRGKLEFDGVVVTDAMVMRAISDNFGINEAVKMAIVAGADILCMPLRIRCQHDEQQLKSLFEYIKNAVENGEISEEQINKSVERILKIKEKYLLFDDLKD